MTDDSGGTPPNDAPSRRSERRRDAAPTPLSDSAFPGFDATVVPPKPELPPEATPGMSTGEHNAIREQWRAKRGEFENHVSHAKDQLD